MYHNYIAEVRFIAGVEDWWVGSSWMAYPKHVLASGHELNVFAHFEGGRKPFKLPSRTSQEGLVIIHPVYDEDLGEGTEWAVQSRSGPDKGVCRILRVLAKYQGDKPRDFQAVNFSRI
jgi:hypothetical protein